MYLKHGKSKTPEYHCWQQIKARCLDPKHQAYPNYGARGITVYEGWVDNFLEFLKDVGMRPSGKHSLDRLDNNGPYAPDNVAWKTATQQNRNRRPHGEGVVTYPSRPGWKTNFKHGMIGTPEYRSWDAMKTRCLNPKSPNYPQWGGRGVKIHPLWIEDYPAFLAYLGPRPSPTHSLDRYPDKDGDYVPGNIRWATKREQNLNRRPTLTGPEHGNSKHNLTKTPEYKTWGSIKTRCFNERSDKYASYGALGITMCQRWKDSFETFLEDLGVKPSAKHTVSRIDHAGHYSCGKCAECVGREWSLNCQWATSTEKNRSRRTSKHSGKLDAKKVKAMRARSAMGLSDATVAVEFGVNRSLVGKIRRNENWVFQ